MKKIIALIVVSAIIISILNISVYAVDLDEAEDNGWHDSGETIMTNQEYYAAQSYLIDKFCSGEITYSQFQEQSQAITDKYLILNRDPVSGALEAGALNASNNMAAISEKIGATVQKWGDGARERVSDWWNSVCNKNNVPTETVQTSTTDMPNGCGAYYIRYSDGGEPSAKLEADYIVLDFSKSGKVRIGHYQDSSPACPFYGYSNGNWKRNGYSGNSGGSYINVEDLSFYKFYGDVRTIGADEYPTDDEFEYSNVNNFDDMPERDLEDLFNDLAETIEQNNPDLSTIEGLLKAIYARMGTLDSDNDNDLLASINSSILALLKADKDKNDKEDSTNEELLKTLLDIRDSLKNGTLGTSHDHEISGTLYNVIPLDKNWLNKAFHGKENLKVQYEGKIYYLEDCSCLKLGDKYYTPNMNYDSYAFADFDFSNENIDTDKYINFNFTNYNDVSVKLTVSQRKKIDNIVDLLYKMISQAVPYAAITSSFAPFEVIIFNTAVPEDIILNFEGTSEVGGFSATILSVSFFQNSYVAAAMGIVKPFLTVVIGYCWLKVMRRKAVSMLG